MPREKLMTEEINELKEELRQLDTETFEVEDLVDTENNVASTSTSTWSTSTSTSTASCSCSTSCASSSSSA